MSKKVTYTCDNCAKSGLNSAYGMSFLPTLLKFKDSERDYIHSVQPEHAGDYHFCCEECLTSFLLNAIEEDLIQETPND